MQNTPQAFRGAAAPGVNFSEHAYDNHVGAHCPPSGYQPYSNPPYHPAPSQRPHHYANHQMQQNMPYRHHGGAYTPNQNQYGQNMNQDVYRNHHSGYGGPNARNMPSKQWPENNSPDMIPPYGQVSHPPMMNNQQQMPMRSPPHATSNMNPVPPQGQQHYRQMQSPAHSPHSWSQGQIPSPGVMHSSRTTPSPLSAHVRSPGHSQPFSPPAAMNMPPHPPQPENGQLPQPINQTGSNDPANPLHSLQKMVMLESDSKAMHPMMGDGNEPFPNQCGPNNYVAESGCNEAKDTNYSTYYNMDENRFESKRNIASSDPSLYTEVQQVSNCNYPLQSHPTGCEEMNNPPPIPSIGVSHSAENSQSPMPIPNLPIPQVQCNTNVNQSDVCSSISECPPHAESAPVFTDQTKAAVSTNSELALESKSNWVSPESAGLPPSMTLGNTNSADELSSKSVIDNSLNNCSSDSHTPDASIKSEDMSCSSEIQSANVAIKQESPVIFSEPNNNSSQCNDQVISKQVNPNVDANSPSSEDTKHNPTTNEENNSKNDVESIVKKENSPENEQKDNVKESSTNSPCSEEEVSSASGSNLTNQSATNSYPSSAEDMNPVKVVIHRIRKCESDNTWHVPDEDIASKKVEDKKHESKIPNVGPQILILSPNSSPQKKFGFQSSVESSSVITIDEESNDEIKIIDTVSSPSKSPKKKAGEGSSSGSSPKKRGRPFGAKTKNRSVPSNKKKKNLKGGKKKKQDLDKQKASETSVKSKKTKIFNGPYVHITGNKDNPSSISVINVAQKEEEKVSKVPLKRTFNNNTVKSKAVGHISTLSPTYDAFNRDKTWLCVFCHKGSHMNGLGDLYGPYYIKRKNSEKPTPSTSRTKRRKSDNDDNRASKRAKQASGHSSTDTTPMRKKMVAPEGEERDLHEVWLHEDCAVWCQGIAVMAEEVHGLEEAVTESLEHMCSECKNTGATLGCWAKGCKEQFHFCCAKHTGCQMNIENFSLLCPNHQKKNSTM